MAKKKMKVAILCGGMGQRFKGHIDGLPKALVKIGGKPILWHIMKYYEYYGFRNFILCLGYMGDAIKDYFRNQKNWDITYADTGLNTNTGGRIKRIENCIEEENFFATYGDGLSDIDLNKLIKFHESNRRAATITCVRPHSPFGIVNIGKDNLVSSFDEKPVLSQWINGGFFVFNKKIFDYLGENDILEKKPFEKMAVDKNLAAYKFNGFWKCMDTYKDHLVLNELWDKKKAVWAKWLKRSRA